MGPQHIAAENATPACGSGAMAPALQWGRSTSLRKTLQVSRRLQGGGRFNGAAAHRCGKLRFFPLQNQGVRKLQWGRSTSLRKTERPRPRSSSRRPLQWGRSTSLRKTAGPRYRRSPRRSFNGAAAHRCGKPQGALGDVLSLAHASMGPQHIAAENGAVGPRDILLLRLQWGRSTSLRKTIHTRVN